MRSKEDAHDYRYFPDPDLLPLEFDDKFIETIKKEIPELPDQKKIRFIEKFKLSPYEATILVSDLETSKFFEKVIEKSDVKLSANWITGELFALLNEKNLEINQSPISPENLSKLINLISDGTISGKIAKTIFEIMSKEDKDPSIIVEEKGLKQESDPKALEALIQKVLSSNEDKVKQYKSGKDKLFGFFVGQVMKESKGKGNPQLINKILKENLMDKNINIDHKLIEYIFSHTNNLHPIQKELLKYNENLGHIKRLQISILQANFLQFLIKSKSFKSCLELGTFTGYSTLSMALSLPKNGKIHTIDIDNSKNIIAKSFFKKAKVLNKIKTEISNANVALDKLVKGNKKFDLILIDADKENYINYFNKSLRLLNKKGMIIVDNILWKGEVINNNSRDKINTKIKNFNTHVKKSKINKYILPIGDGFYICWK